MTPEQVDRMTAAIRAEIDRRFADYMRATSTANKSAADGLFESIKGFVIRNVGPVAKRVDELERARTMSWQGPHDVSVTYQPGAVTQRQSSTWVALVATQELPGQSPHWRRIGLAS